MSMIILHKSILTNQQNSFELKISQEWSTNWWTIYWYLSSFIYVSRKHCQVLIEMKLEQLTKNICLFVPEVYALSEYIIIYLVVSKIFMVGVYSMLSNIIQYNIRFHSLIVGCIPIFLETHLWNPVMVYEFPQLDLIHVFFHLL